MSGTAVVGAVAGRAAAGGKQVASVQGTLPVLLSPGVGGLEAPGRGPFGRSPGVLGQAAT